MDLQTRKITFVQEFLRIQNEKLIGELEHLLRTSRTELYEKNLEPMSLEQFNNEIDRALEDSKERKLTNVSDLKQKINRWS